VDRWCYNGHVSSPAGRPPRASSAPGDAPAPTLAPERSVGPTAVTDDPSTDDHERMAHIVLEGFRPEGGDYVSAGPTVVEGIVNGTAVRALCGKVWVPGRDPKRYPLCPTCKEIAEGMGWKVPAT
jgi:hypothetical protein